jgi:hypothetical protein
VRNREIAEKLETLSVDTLIEHLRVLGGNIKADHSLTNDKNHVINVVCDKNRLLTV